MYLPVQRPNLLGAAQGPDHLRLRRRSLSRILIQVFVAHPALSQPTLQIGARGAQVDLLPWPHHGLWSAHVACPHGSHYRCPFRDERSTHLQLFRQQGSTLCRREGEVHRPTKNGIWPARPQCRWCSRGRRRWIASTARETLFGRGISAMDKKELPLPHHKSRPKCLDCTNAQQMWRSRSKWRK